MENCCEETHFNYDCNINLDRYIYIGWKKTVVFFLKTYQKHIRNISANRLGHTTQIGLGLGVMWTLYVTSQLLLPLGTSATGHTGIQKLFMIDLLANWGHGSFWR